MRQPGCRRGARGHFFPRQTPPSARALAPPLRPATLACHPRLTGTTCPSRPNRLIQLSCNCKSRPPSHPLAEARRTKLDVAKEVIKGVLERLSPDDCGERRPPRRRGASPLPCGCRVRAAGGAGWEAAAGFRVGARGGPGPAFPCLPRSTALPARSYVFSPRSALYSAHPPHPTSPFPRPPQSPSRSSPTPPPPPSAWGAGATPTRQGSRRASTACAPWGAPTSRHAPRFLTSLPFYFVLCWKAGKGPAAHVRGGQPARRAAACRQAAMQP